MASGAEATADAKLERVNVYAIVDEHTMKHWEVEEDDDEPPQRIEVDHREIDIIVTDPVDQLKGILIEEFSEVPPERRDPNNWDLFFVDGNRRVLLGDQGTLRTLRIEVEGSGTMRVEQCLSGPHSSLELKTPRLMAEVEPQQPQQNFPEFKVKPKVSQLQG